MALFNPPFHALPQKPTDPEPPPNFDQWPSYAPRPDRLPLEQWDGEPGWRWMWRCYNNAVYWAEEDVREAAEEEARRVVKGRPRSQADDSESREERKARLNREAQARFRVRKAAEKAGVSVTTLMLETARNEVKLFRSKLANAEATLRELEERAKLGEDAA